MAGKSVYGGGRGEDIVGIIIVRLKMKGQC